MRMIEEYNRSAEPLLRGWGGYDFACMGFAVSGGHRFPWPEGCYVLRRRRIYPDVGEWTLCGTAPLDATSIKNGPGFDHQADMAYQYEVATVFGNGQASAFCEPVRVDFDGSVQLIDPLPMFPRNLRARPIAGGQFLVTWDYDPYGHGAWPKDFQVFGGPDAGSIDYNTPLTDSVSGLAYVPVYGAQRRFEFTTAAFANGTVKVFGVRARNAAAVAEKNTRTSKAAAAMASVAASFSTISQAVQGRSR